MINSFNKINVQNRDTYRDMRELSQLFSDIARERYAEVGYLWRIADIFFPFCFENEGLYVKRFTKMP